MRFKVIKTLPYNTRQLLADNSYAAGTRTRPQILAGEIVEVDDSRGRLPLGIRILVRGKKLEEVRAPVHVPPPPPEVKAKIEAAVTPHPLAIPPHLDRRPQPGSAMTTGRSTGGESARPKDKDTDSSR